MDERVKETQECKLGCGQNRMLQRTGLMKPRRGFTLVAGKKKLGPGKAVSCQVLKEMRRRLQTRLEKKKG